jgi:hypothetical protein
MRCANLRKVGGALVGWFTYSREFGRTFARVESE